MSTSDPTEQYIAQHRANSTLGMKYPKEFCWKVAFSLLYFLNWRY